MNSAHVATIKVVEETATKSATLLYDSHFGLWDFSQAFSFFAPSAGQK